MRHTRTALGKRAQPSDRVRISLVKTGPETFRFHATREKEVRVSMAANEAGGISHCSWLASQVFLALERRGLVGRGAGWIWVDGRGTRWGRPLRDGLLQKVEARQFDCASTLGEIFLSQLYLVAKASIQRLITSRNLHLFCRESTSTQQLHHLNSGSIAKKGTYPYSEQTARITA